MAQIEAWQHIYTNVEQEQSPRQRGGFQTLFYTQSALTEAEVEEMEGRLLYFPSETVSVKRVFFVTSTGKVVVGQIVSLPEPDRLGRKGRYLAHSLVFAPEAFVRLGANPFRVFANFSFITTVAQALEQGDFQTGNKPAVLVRSSAFRQENRRDKPPEGGTTNKIGTAVPDEGAEAEVEAAKVWQVDELKKLALLALRADRLASERSTVVFVGEPKQVESALAAALLAVPAALLPRCTFDTYFYGCNPVHLYYWAVGLPQPPTNPRFVVVDARARRVTGDSGGASSSPETSYERWVAQMMGTGRDGDSALQQVARHRDNAFALCEWLDGRDAGLPLSEAKGRAAPTLVDAAPPEVVNSVFEVNAQQVRERLRGALGQQLPPGLVNRVFEPVYRQSNPTELLQQLRSGFERSTLLELLYQIYAAQGFRAPEREEVKALETLLEHADHRGLRLLHACWANQRGRLKSLLQDSSEDEYRQFAQTALHFRIVEPLTLLISGRGDAFLDLYLPSRTERTDDLVALVEALLTAGDATSVSRLVPYVPKQSAKELRALERIVNKHPDIPEDFRHAVIETMEGLPPKQGLKGFIRTLLAFGREKKRSESEQTGHRK